MSLEACVNMGLGEGRGRVTHRKFIHIYMLTPPEEIINTAVSEMKR